MNLKAICTLVTGMVGAVASAISITANTTVTEANVADYVAADIDIAAGATLTFSGTGDPGSIPRSGRSTGGGNGNPLQYSCLENPMDRGAWLGCSPKGCKGSDTTEHTHIHLSQNCLLLPCSCMLMAWFGNG